MRIFAALRNAINQAMVDLDRPDGATAQAVVLLNSATGQPSGGGALATHTITRPTNTTAYTAGDVVGGVLTFPNLGSAGDHIMLTSLDLRMDIAAIPVGMSSFRLYLYSSTPPSALADNAAWVSHSAGVVTLDRPLLVGFVDLSLPALLGGTPFVQVDGINKHVKLGAGETSLYGYLVTNGGYTPAANSEVYVARLRAVAL